MGDYVWDRHDEYSSQGEPIDILEASGKRGQVVNMKSGEVVWQC